MKKLITGFLLVFFVASASSQNKFKLSFIASPQLSWLASDSRDIKKGKNFLGFGYGIEGDFFLGSDNYAICTGMTVSTLGGSLIYTPPVLLGGRMLPAGTQVDYAIKYLEFPLALKLRTKEFNRARFYAQFGLNNWLNLKTKLSTSDGSFQKEVTKNEIRMFNSGLNVGGGVEYDLGHGNSLTLGLIFSNSFSDATSNSTVNDATTLKELRFRTGFIF